MKEAGGLIVRKEWIIDCHRKKTKLSSDKLVIVFSSVPVRI